MRRVVRYGRDGRGITIFKDDIVKIIDREHYGKLGRITKIYSDGLIELEVEGGIIEIQAENVEFWKSGRLMNDEEEEEEEE